MRKVRRRKVFCVGLGKTGTTSFGRIMKQLGYLHLSGPVGIMLALREVGRMNDLWDIVNRFESFDDFPYPYLYRECVERFPNAIYVLTTRRSPEKWLESLRSHNRAVGPSDAFLLAYGCYSVDANEERLLALYERHNQEVRDFFAGTGRLLEVCWEDGTGVDRLGEFLRIEAGQSITVPRVNAAANRSHARVVEALCAQRRFGAAARYARGTDAADELMQIVNRAVDAQLREIRAYLQLPVETVYATTSGGGGLLQHVAKAYRGARAADAADGA
jgi:hypothetical protein